MHQKEVSSVISNFEVDKEENKVVVFINPRIFPVSIVNKTAAYFKEKAWISINGDPREELLVEIKPKKEYDLELLGREFNNKLLENSTNGIKIEKENPALISKIKEVVKEFISEEEGKISKQSIMTIGAVLAGIGLVGLAQDVSAQCGTGGGDSCASNEGGATSNDGGCCDGCGNGHNCLLYGSLVLAENNELIKIQDLKVGSIVQSFVVETEKIINTKITKIITNHPRNHYYKINEELLITNDHPVLVLTKFGLAWKTVEKLKIGDYIKSIEGYIKVKCLEKIDIPAKTVYMETESESFIAKAGDNFYVVKSKYMPTILEKIIPKKEITVLV